MVLMIALSLLVFLSATFLLIWVKTPHYQLDRNAVRRLLELVLSGNASSSDWVVFTALPLRHDELLESIRIACLKIEDDEYSEELNPPFLFTKTGIELLRHQLNRLTLNTNSQH